MASLSPVAWSGGRASSTRLERAGSFARVVALAVDPARRRAGLGRRLLTAVESWAAELGCHDIEITSSRHRGDAHAFYRSLGFVDQCDGSARFRRPLAVTSTDRSAR